MNYPQDWKQAAQTGDFFGLIRLVEASHKEFPRVGRALSPQQEPVRFRQPAGLAFATRTIEPPEQSGNAVVVSEHFFGLLGPNGPLPSHLTEFIRDRQRNARDGTLASFLDIFHQRALELFYRAWAVNNKAVDMDRPEEARFTAYFGSLFGESEGFRSGPERLPRYAKCFYAGLLARQTRSADALEALLADFFELPAKVLPLIGQWLKIPADCRTRLGGHDGQAILGETAVLGLSVWDVQNRFRVRLGPMGLERFRGFLPGSHSALRLIEWIREFTLDSHRWDLQLVLRKEEIPLTCLGTGSALGWTTWVHADGFAHDSDAVILTIQPTFKTHQTTS